MRKWLLGTAALLALVGPAISADLRTPVYKAPPPLVPVWSWSGCFVGGHAARLRAKSESWIVRTPGGDFFGQPLGGHSFLIAGSGAYRPVATISSPAAS